MSNAAPTVTAPTVSALIVAHNEEAMIGSCLESVAFCDEIVVVLDRCTDRTKQLAEQAGAILVEGAWPVEGPRRHAGIDACTSDWILEVDADERVTPELATEIRATLSTAPLGHMLIPFHNYIGQTLVLHGWGAYNGVGSKSCLFTKGTKHWGDQLVHPSVKYEGQRTVLTQPIIHLVDENITDMYDRLNRDTTKAAKDAVRDNKVPSLSRSVRRIFTRFFKVYVSRKGYREGTYGLALGIYAAVYPILVYIKCQTDAQD